MPSPVLRRALATVSTLACLVAARSAHADDASVRIETGDENLEVFLRTDQVAMLPVRSGRFGTRLGRSPVYAAVCAQTPCEPTLEQGTYHLALSKPDGAVVEADAPIDINGATTLRGTYTDRSVWRGIGLAAVIVMPLAGTGLMFVGSHTVTEGGASVLVLNGGALAAGIGVAAVGLVASIALMMQHDSVEFTIGPLAVGRLPGARESGAAAAVPNGLELTMRF